MRFVLLAMTLALLTTGATAAERMPLGVVNIQSLTKDTQVTPPDAGDRHLALVWWVPNEFWKAIFARDLNSRQDEKEQMLKAFEGFSVAAVVQADISEIGLFDFYSKAEIAENFSLSYNDTEDKEHPLAIVQDVPLELKFVLARLTPVLESAMGNMGQNLQFFVVHDKSPTGNRLVDPYEGGNLAARVARRDGKRMTAEITLPVDALYIPRKCPNGKPAHITWRYCPWTGKKLQD